MKIKLFVSFLSFFILLSCGGNKENKNTTPNVPTIKNSIKIAYYIQDSLKTGYDYYREVDSTTKIKQDKFQNQLEQKQRWLQNYVMENEQRAKSGQLSAIEIQSIQQEAQRKEQELYQFQQTEGSKLENETVEILEVLSKRVEAAGKKYCKEHGIQLLLVHGTGGQINFIDPSMNVTKEFIAYLNQHQAEIEKDLKVAEEGTKKK